MEMRDGKWEKYHSCREKREALDRIEMASSCPPQRIHGRFWQGGAEGRQVGAWGHVGVRVVACDHGFGEEVDVRWVGEGVGLGDGV